LSALDEDLEVVRSTAGWLVGGAAATAQRLGSGARTTALAAARMSATRIAERGR
jgi:hypothetical protein